MRSCMLLANDSVRMNVSSYLTNVAWQNFEVQILIYNIRGAGPGAGYGINRRAHIVYNAKYICESKTDDNAANSNSATERYNGAKFALKPCEGFGGIGDQSCTSNVGCWKGGLK